MTSQYYSNVKLTKQVETAVQASTATYKITDTAAYQFSYLPLLNLTPAPAAPETPTKSTYSQPEIVQSTYFDHVTRFTPLRDDAWSGLEVLHKTFTEGETAFENRFNQYVAKYFTDPVVESFFGQRSLVDFFGVDTTALLKLTPPIQPKFLPFDDKNPDASRDKETQSQQHLFAAGKTLVEQNRTAERIRQGLNKLALVRGRELTVLKNQLADLEQNIVDARTNLGALDRARRESQDDYAVAQRLLLQMWQDLLAKLKQRQSILENHQGLFYVRARQTPVEQALTRPQNLTYTDADDIVPGCDSEAEPLPESLIPFMEAVLEIAATDWAVLKPLYHLLPSRNRLDSMLRLRNLRINDRAQSTAAQISSEFQSSNLFSQHLAVMGDLARVKVKQAISLSDLQQQSHAVLSLEDLVSGPAQDLRQPALTLQGKLHQAASCLAERLRTVPASIRRQWAVAVDNGSLPLATPEYWPGLGEVEKVDYENTKVLVALVRWWFSQLSPDPSNPALAAMQNLLRAEILLAATEDPAHLLQGTVKTPPGSFRVGAVMRLQLNREAPPGTLLQLFHGQQVVGSIRVEDHDGDGTVAKVIATDIADLQVTTAFKAIGSTLSSKKIRS